MTATKERPLITKHQPGPKNAYASPPTDGPTTIAMLFRFERASTRRV